MNQPPLTLALLRSAFRVANRAVVADIESYGVRVGRELPPVYDVRPMLDVREHAPEVVDMAREALAYGLACGLIECVGPQSVRLLEKL